MVSDVWYESAGDRLYAHVAGEGPALVWTHGAFSTHNEVQHLMAPLDGLVRVSMDVRGRGRSICRDPLKHSFNQYADDVALLLDHLGIDRAVIGGNSMGTGVVLGAALRHPDRVAGLVLAQCGLRGNGDALDVDPPVTRAQIDAMSEDERHEQARAQLMRSFAKAIPNAPEQLAKVVDGFLGRNDPGSIIAISCRPARQPFGRLEDLADIKAPALVVPSMDDMHPSEVAERYVELIPNARWAEVEGPAKEGAPAPGGWAGEMTGFVHACL